MPGALQLRVAARTDAGPERDYNEDAVALFTPSASHDGAEAFTATVPTDAGAALVVIDAMAPARMGDRVCRIVCEFLAEQLAREWPAQPDARAAWFADLLRRASGRVDGDGTQFAGQGATVAIAVVVGDLVHLLNVGDVRGYLLRDGRLELRSVDDSFLAHARESGVPEAELPQLRGVVVQALGFRKPEPHVQTLRLAVGDGLLLCSDGLHDAVAHADMEEALRGRDPAAACAALVELAIRARSPDNISALVARLGRAPG